MEIEDKLKNIPAKPGCYLFKDGKGEIIYIGKAAVLRNRVRSYFQKSRAYHPKLEALVSHINDVEWFITDSEVEALILENNLVKEYLPRYNIDLKDDKSFPYIRITKEDFPQVFITRKIIRDGSEYFGPYTQVKNVRYILKTLKQIFPIRSCKYKLTPDVIEKGKVQLCLDYFIGKCKGPCQNLQSKEEYERIIGKVRSFLKGKTEFLVKELKEEMQTLSASLAFEEAAKVRDKLNALENYRNSQKVVLKDYVDRDLIALAREGGDACVVVFKVRESMIIGRTHFYLKKVDWQTDAEITETFINRFYSKNQDVPKEIFLQEELENAGVLEQWLSSRLSGKVSLLVPRIGEKKKLMKMVEKNARYLLEELKLQKMKAKDQISYYVQVLQKDLKLKRPPKRMECFDISNIQGTDPVASMVCFENGKPKKSDYRRYKIQAKDTPDDFAMMREVIKRRYSRLLKEEKPLPDLIIVDGGKGQLSSALQILKELGIENQQVIGLAKRLEEVFLPGYHDAQMLPHTSGSIKLLQQIRDEAHRFAITFHRQRRGKRTLTSELDKIPGVGAKRRERLMKALGSVKKIKEASIAELVEAAGLPKNVAGRVYDYFHPKKQSRQA